MTDDLVEQLRARNPAPPPVPAPPIDHVLARIAAGERPAGPRWPQWAAPSLAVAVAAAVAAVALVSLHGHHAARPAGHVTRRTPMVIQRLGPGEAMRGSLQSSVLAFDPAGNGVIGWTQLRAASTPRPRSWLATTSDGGRSWSVRRRSFSLFATPVFDGSGDGWTQGVDSSRALRSTSPTTAAAAGRRHRAPPRRTL